MLELLLLTASELKVFFLSLMFVEDFIAKKLHFDEQSCVAKMRIGFAFQHFLSTGWDGEWAKCVPTLHPVQK